MFKFLVLWLVVFAPNLTWPLFVPSLRRSCLCPCVTRRLLQAVSSSNRMPEWAAQASIQQHHSTIQLSLCHLESELLISPRAWLEFGSDGAYTVLRCECHNNSSQWIVRGQDFHLQRLCHSYHRLLESSASSSSSSSSSSSLTQRTEKPLDCCDTAVQDTKTILEALLSCATSTLLQQERPSNGTTLAMCTILWFPREEDDRIQVHGHVTLASTPAHPFTAVVVVAPSVAWADMSLPSRKLFPDAKLSKWCRDRRILEDLFLLNKNQEVLLTAPARGRLEEPTVALLEGLTSNLFVLYWDGVLRTAESSEVLGGYARQCVIEAALQLGIRVVEKAPGLSDSHLWEEVFLTSSVKLIVPVSELLVPMEDDGVVVQRMVWSSEHRQSPNVWPRLYEAIKRSA